MPSPGNEVVTISGDESDKLQAARDITATFFGVDTHHQTLDRTIIVGDRETTFETGHNFQKSTGYIGGQGARGISGRAVLHSTAIRAGSTSSVHFIFPAYYSYEIIDGAFLWTGRPTKPRSSNTQMMRRGVVRAMRERILRSFDGWSPSAKKISEAIEA